MSKEQKMVNQDFLAIVDSEAEHYEENYYKENSTDNPEPGIRRGNGSAPRLLTVRLSGEQYDQVAAAAKAADLPVSTYARNELMAGVVAGQQASSVVVALEDALRQTLKPELLRV
jgi:hypothetical protein